MCNACGFRCCAWDGFSGCGCDCRVMECTSRCPECGHYEADWDGCVCELDAYDPADDYEPPDDERADGEGA